MSYVFNTLKFNFFSGFCEAKSNKKIVIYVISFSFFSGFCEAYKKNYKQL